MKNELIYLLNTSIAIFVIIDPFALVPVYLSLTERFSSDERKVIRVKASLMGLGILLLFAFCGVGIFSLFGITLPAFRIAGGILLLVFGITQLNSKRERVTETEKKESLDREDISIFPLATPLIAGPGAISTVVLMSSEVDTSISYFLLIVSIVIVAALNHFILKIAPLIYRVLGRTGLNLITRLMGIIVSSVAIQFIITGIKEAFAI